MKKLLLTMFFITSIYANSSYTENSLNIQALSLSDLEAKVLQEDAQKSEEKIKELGAVLNELGRDITLGKE